MKSTTLPKEKELKIKVTHKGKRVKTLKDLMKITKFWSK